MRKYYVIGNPIDHSISPKIHNYWFKENNIKAVYEKMKLSENELGGFVKKIRNNEIDGINVTVPFKEKIIKFVDELTNEAKEANSVNTIYLSDNKIIGHNTDIVGFYLSLQEKKIDFKKNKTLILGSGGVTPSIIIALKRLGAENITITNRTKEKALKLKERFNDLEILEWGKGIDAKIVINTTSLGLNEKDNIELDQKIYSPNSFFYDLIYKPSETNFLKKARGEMCMVQNGLMMFIYQASEAFKTWHKINPKINENLINFLKND